MSIALLNGISGATIGNATTVTMPSGGPTAGNLLVAGVISSNDATSTITVSDTLANTWTQAGTYSTNGTVRASIWYTVCGASGADNVTASASGAVLGVSIGVIEYTGAATSSVLDGVAGNTGNAATTLTAGSVPVAGAGDTLFAQSCF
jgi:hypothetical protein